MRRLRPEELEAIADALGATSSVEVTSVTTHQATEPSLVDAMAGLLVAIVGGRPFDRRNDAVAIAAVDVLARLNGSQLDLEPPEDVVAMVAAVRAGSALDLRNWLDERLTHVVAPIGPRCPACSMPLREALDVQGVGRLLIASCGGCGHLFVQPFRRPLLEV